MSEVVVPIITNSALHLNALLIQPTSFCALNCEGCYAKNFKNASHQTLMNFVASLSNPKYPVRANQITMAVDVLPKSNDSYEFEVLTDFFKYFHFAARSNTLQTEYHITVNHINNLKTYLDYLEYHEVALSYFQMISVSNLTDIPKSWKHKTHWNWNLTLFPSDYPDISKINTQETKDWFVSQLNKVDSCYLVLHKPSTGDKVGLHSFKIFIEFKKMIDSLLPEQRAKVNFDTCFTDSQKYLSTNRGCSANVSKFQIWPDGSVTGCPYKQTPDTPSAKNLQEIFANFVLAKNKYNFNSCNIPDAIYQEQNPTNKYNPLRIMEIF